MKSNFDVIVFTETWLHENVSSSLINNCDYTTLRLDRQTKVASGLVKKGGGLCIMIKKDITIDLSHCVSISNQNIELFHVNIKKGMASRINIVGVYRPPTGNLANTVEELDCTVKTIRENFKGEVVCLGDFNVDVLKGHKPAQSLLSWASDAGLKQLITEYTRVTSNSETCIDLIFTDIPSVFSSGAIEFSISDHFPVYLIKKKTRNEKNCHSIRCRSFKNFNLEAFCTDLMEFDFDLSPTEDVNDLWNLMWNFILSVCDKHCPFVTFTAKSKPDYITDEILSMMRKRDLAYKTAHRTKKAEDLSYAKTLRQELTRELRKAKRRYILLQLDLAKGNSKKSGKLLTQILCQKVISKLTVFGTIRLKIFYKVLKQRNILIIIFVI